MQLEWLKQVNSHRKRNITKPESDSFDTVPCQYPDGENRHRRRGWVILPQIRCSKEGNAKHYFSFQAQSNAGCQLMPQLSRTIQRRWSHYFQQSQEKMSPCRCNAVSLKVRFVLKTLVTNSPTNSGQMSSQAINLLYVRHKTTHSLA